MTDYTFASGRIVRLRALTPSDAERCAPWFNDASVTRHMNKGQFPNTPTQQAEYFERLHRSRTDVQLGIALIDGDALVGTIGLHRIDWIHRRGDIGIVVGDPTARGKGVATEAIGLMVVHAFEKLNLHKVTAGMWVTNVSSRKAFENNGFVVEATLRQSFWQTDRYVDEWRLGLLRSDWEKMALARSGG